MPTSILAPLTLLLGGLASWWAASRAARSSRLFYALVGVSLGSILLWFTATTWTDLGFALLTWDDWLFFERPVLFLAIFLLLALCLRRLDRRRQIVVGTIAALFALYALAETAAPLGAPLWADRLSDRTNVADDGQQSTSWSCGAAALAWALRQQGIGTSEREVALLAATNPLHGTTDRGLIRAANALGCPMYATGHASWEELAAAPQFALVGWNLGSGVAHMVVVVRVETDQVWVHDPLTGDQRYSRQEFMARWMRDLVQCSN